MTQFNERKIPTRAKKLDGHCTQKKERHKFSTGD